MHASDYVAVGVPSIMPVNIGDNRLIKEGIAQITETDAERLRRHRVKAGDIVYSRRGDVERRALVRISEVGWLCGTGCLLVRVSDGVADPVYASYYLGHPSVREWIVRHAVGAIMPNLNTEIMAAVPFALPPMPEQRAIAKVLGSLDDKIDLNRRMNETLEAMAGALFRSWFVDFDPVRAKQEGRQPPGLDAATAALFPDSFADSPLGSIPTGWFVKPVFDVAELISGGTPSTSNPKYWGGAISWASAKDVSQCGDAFLVTTERTITEAGLSNSSTKIVPAFTTVVVARGATTGRFTMFSDDIGMNQTCYGLRSRDGLHFYFNCLFHDLVSELVHAAHGSVFDTITTATFERTRVAVPHAAIRQAFERRVEGLFKKVLANLHQAQTLSALRDALLPKLLSGEIRVKQADEIVESAR